MSIPQPCPPECALYASVGSAVLLVFFCASVWASRARRRPADNLSSVSASACWPGQRSVLGLSSGLERAGKLFHDAGGIRGHRAKLLPVSELTNPRVEEFGAFVGEVLESRSGAEPIPVGREGSSSGGACRLAQRWMSQRDQILSWLEESPDHSGPPDSRAPTTVLRAQVLRWIHGVQPFFVLSPEAESSLERLLADLLGGLRGACRSPDVGVDPSNFTQALEVFARLLASWVDSLGLGHARDQDAVVAAEYSPELQLSVLGLELAAMKEPVLDLGCGEQARLVEYLRARGKAAVGIDRYASRGEATRVVDWFSLPLLPRSWGTVIAHQSFTLHFLHHHLRDAVHAERYARRYMEILSALGPGGAFVYAPGLPFLEPLLARERFRVAKRALAIAPPERAPLTQWLEVLGESPLYACRVEPADD
jgi:hypothetical protein